MCLLSTPSTSRWRRCSSSSRTPGTEQRKVTEWQSREITRCHVTGGWELLISQTWSKLPASMRVWCLVSSLTNFILLTRLCFNTQCNETKPAIFFFFFYQTTICHPNSQYSCTPNQDDGSNWHSRSKVTWWKRGSMWTWTCCGGQTSFWKSDTSSCLLFGKTPLTLPVS